jgi:hypothetical protein
VLLDWIEEVAARAAAAPLGELDLRGVVLVGTGVGVVVAATRHRRTGARVAGSILVGLVLVGTVAVAQRPPSFRNALGPGVVRWHGDGVDVVALGGGSWRDTLDAEGVLELLRRDGVGAIELLVLVDTRVPPVLVDVVTARHPTATVITPDEVPVEGTTVDVGRLRVLLVPGKDRLVVEAIPGRL